MIGSLRGTIEGLHNGKVILEVQGVGYLVNVPTSFIQNHRLGERVLVHTYPAVREDALTLFGFEHDSEKDLFELLVGVSGIGPRLGLSIVSAYSAAEIQSAIASGDSAAFTAISGIGKKNAERIILELKNKVGVSQILPASTTASAELQAAMTSLGYNPAEVAKATMQVDSTLPLAEQIKLALSRLSKND